MTKGYVCYCKDNYLRSLSTSGGAFGVLSKTILNNNGIIYGVKFNEKFQAVHGRAENWENVIPFQGSKYIQSNLQSIFKNIKQDVNAGRKVLFSGTPCQIAALQQYLSENEKENVIFVDFICKGIPSPKVWDLYLSGISEGRKVKDICFKEKRKGWSNFTFVITFEDGSEYVEDGRSNLFMKGFFSGLTVRPSCFKCPFRGIERKSDFTIGDAWGLEKIHPEMFDDKGTSILFIHTNSGMELFNEIEHQFFWKEFEIQQVRYNVEKKWTPDKRREKFHRISEEKGVIAALEICTRQNSAARIKAIIMRIYILWKKNLISRI